MDKVRTGGPHQACLYMLHANCFCLSQPSLQPLSSPSLRMQLWRLGSYTSSWAVHLVA